MGALASLGVLGSGEVVVVQPNCETDEQARRKEKETN